VPEDLQSRYRWAKEEGNITDVAAAVRACIESVQTAA
jgi:hypothetical protein